jgi:hypothetical protein
METVAHEYRCGHTARVRQNGSDIWGSADVSLPYSCLDCVNGRLPLGQGD